MRLANITLKIDDDILKKARLIAAEKKTSINAIIKERIEEFISQDLKKDTALKGLDSFFKRSKARIGNKTWTRSDIHER